MRIFPIFGLVLGLSIFIALILWQGLGDIFGVLISGGWELLALPVIWLPCLPIAAISWRMLLPCRPKFRSVLVALWIGRAINTLLPVATIGGEIAKARLITLWGAKGVTASASVLVDKSVQAIAVAIWAYLGALLLVYLAIDNELAFAVTLGTTALVAGLLIFILIQKAGIVGLIAKLAGKLVHQDSLVTIVTNAHEVDTQVRKLYRDYARITIATLWRTLALIIQTAEVCLACYLLGYPIDLTEALMLKALTSTISDIAFFVPGAYGIQEGSYLMLGGLLGMPPGLALAVSLATRIRELVIDLPGVLTWQYIEAKQLLK